MAATHTGHSNLSGNNGNALHTHAVVVWEYQCHDNKWLPYSPAVSQHLERAHAKKLTRVLLSDADPNLGQLYVNVRTMAQETDDDAGLSTSAVRRMFYTSNSPAGKGIRWEWAGGTTDNDWRQYSMHVQCIIEDAWTRGEKRTDLRGIGMPYIINLFNMTQMRQPNGPMRSLKRTQQAPYPLVKLSNQQATQLNSFVNYREYHPTRNNTLPKISTESKRFQRPMPPITCNQRQQHPLPITGTIGANSNINSNINHHSHNNNNNNNSQVSRKLHKKSELSTTNLRQIFNNLNIFGQKNTNVTTAASCSTSSMAGTLFHTHSRVHLQAFSHSNSLLSSMKSQRSRCSESSLQSQRSSHIGSHRSRSRTRASDTDSNSIKSGRRRPSVDTVSTYLSHESKESLPSRNFAISVNDLLDCSLGSDEVFVPSISMSSLSDRAPVPPPLPPHSNSIQRAVSSISIGGHQQIQHQPNSIPGSIVGIDPASDMISRFVKVVEPPTWPNAQPCPMCMEELVHSASNPAISLSRCQHLLHLECLNGMIVAQQNEQKKTQQNLFIECPVCGIVYGEKMGNQPNGTMSWSILNKNLPGHEGQNTIQIIYDIVSGIQTVEHPHPGRAFFAVGFPRICYLPDCPLGRKVLRFLKIAFDRRLLFSIGRSATTGREDVVVWNSVDHKTQFNMFPDPTYLQRTLQQLVHLGVTD